MTLIFYHGFSFSAASLRKHTGAVFTAKRKKKRKWKEDAAMKQWKPSDSYFLLCSSGSWHHWLLPWRCMPFKNKPVTPVQVKYNQTGYKIPVPYLAPLSLYDSWCHGAHMAGLCSQTCCMAAGYWMLTSASPLRFSGGLRGLWWMWLRMTQLFSEWVIWFVKPCRWSICPFAVTVGKYWTCMTTLSPSQRHTPSWPQPNVSTDH